MEQKVIFKEQKKVFFSYKDVKMRICVCSKNEDLLKLVKRLIYEYSENHKLELVVDCYKEAKFMLKYPKNYSLLFLELESESNSEFCISEQFKKSNRSASVIFISKRAEYAVKALKYSPVDFLLLPIQKTAFFETLSLFFEQLGNNYPVWIKSRDDTVCLKISQIAFLEANNKHSFIHTYNETFPCNKTMAYVSRLLPSENFIKINRAFIVNFDAVFKFNNEFLSLKNGKSLHISRNYLKNFKSEYRKYINPLEI